MAVTSIWAVKSRIDSVIDYVNNPEKTIEKPELIPEAITARSAVGDVIDYAGNGDKTEQMMFVTGINCDKYHAAEDFMLTKQRWGKTGGRLAYHGYQSFREGPDEMTAMQAHMIGVKLAQELWGDRFEVLVATHLNTGHYHNHFVINSVSFADGLKYVRFNSDYRKMQQASDRLCREAGLHVITDPSSARGKTYDEWIAEREGRYTIRGKIREDIDYAIRLSRTQKQFADAMRDMGYEFKLFKKDGSYLEHPGIKPPGAKGYFRFRSLGRNYEFDAIIKRIIRNQLGSDQLQYLPENSSAKKWEPTEENLKGLPFIYRKYCIRLYSYVSRPRKREYIPMSVREDIRKLHHYIAMLDFLCEYRVYDKSYIVALRESWQKHLNSLLVKRKELYSQKNHAKGLDINVIKAEIADTSHQIRDLRKKIGLCDECFNTADIVAERVNLPDRKPEQPITKPNINRRIRK